MAGSGKLPAAPVLYGAMAGLLTSDTLLKSGKAAEGESAH